MTEVMMVGDHSGSCRNAMVRTCISAGSMYGFN